MGVLGTLVQGFRRPGDAWIRSASGGRTEREISLCRLGGIGHGVGRPLELAHAHGPQAAGLARRFVWAAGSVVSVRVRGG